MTEKLSIKEYRAETRTGVSIKETLLSQQISQLMDALALENDRIQSGQLLALKSYTSRRTGKVKEFRHWVQLSKTGTPDRWCLIHGRWCLVEVKTSGKEPSPEQRRRQNELAAAGAIIINVDSVEEAARQIALLKVRLDPRARERQIRDVLLDMKRSGIFDDLEPPVFVDLIVKAVKVVGESRW